MHFRQRLIVALVKTNIVDAAGAPKVRSASIASI